MKARSFVDNFVMNLFYEALNYDYKHIGNLRPFKFFLATNIMDILKLDDVNLDGLKAAFNPRRIGVAIKKVDMIMIPTNHNLHWWLIVANFKVRCFDVLNSMKMNKHSSDMTTVICNNFRKTWHYITKDPSILDVSKFPIVIQQAPNKKLCMIVAFL